MINAYLTETVTITPQGTLGADGRSDFDGTETTPKARVIYKTGLIRLPDRGDVEYTRVMYFAPTVTIAVNDKVTHDSVEMRVLRVYKPRDLGGTHSYTKVWLV